MSPSPRKLRLLVPLALFALPLLSLDRTGPLTAEGVSAELKQAVEDKGYHVVLDDGWSADFWFARSLATSANGAAGALYPVLANGQFVGAVTFFKGTSDYRGQAIPAGTYTLRYQYIPQDANHMGVSPNPDFLLAIPVAADTSPAENLPFKRLTSLSAKTTATGHPAVFAMAPAGAAVSIAKNDEGMTVFTVEVNTATSGKSQKLGIVLKGQASQ
jgi:hypothetical protein